MTTRLQSGTVKEITVSAISSGETCPECSDRTGIRRETLYCAARRMLMVWPSAVRRRHVKARAHRHYVYYCTRRKMYVVTAGSGLPDIQTFSVHRYAEAFADMLDKRELILIQTQIP